MTCTQAEPLIGASLDGELDPRTALEVDNHVTGCNACAVLLAKLEQLRNEIATADLDWSTNADLRPLGAAIRRGTGEPWWKRPWLRPSAVGAFAAALLVLMVSLPGRPGRSLEQQMIDNHVRSLLADHLVDVPSSDHHTVKPWFQGKLNFSPAVPDLSAEGFVLSGGRLDVVGGSPAAAIVYRRRQHVVNLWIAPTRGADRGIESSSAEGFNSVHWQKDRMLYWAVSDLNAPELRNFAERIRAQ